MYVGLCCVLDTIFCLLSDLLLGPGRTLRPLFFQGVIWILSGQVPMWAIHLSNDSQHVDSLRFLFKSLRKRIGAAYNRHREGCCIQIDCQFGARFRPKREISVAREDHQPDLLPLWNDLIVGLQIEGHLVESSRYEWFTFAERTVVLRIGPAASDNVIGDLCSSAFVPGQGDQPD